MRIIKLRFKTIDIVYADGKMETKTFTPVEFAGFKRSKRYKQILSKKVILQWEVKIKTL